MKLNIKSKITKWLLKKICQRLVPQGPTHRDNIIEYYRVMWKVARREFCEDTGPVLRCFLTECHEKSMKFTVRQSMEHIVEYPEEKEMYIR